MRLASRDAQQVLAHDKCMLVASVDEGLNALRAAAAAARGISRAGCSCVRSLCFYREDGSNEQVLRSKRACLRRQVAGGTGGAHACAHPGEARVFPKAIRGIIAVPFGTDATRSPSLAQGVVQVSEPPGCLGEQWRAVSASLKLRNGGTIGCCKGLAWPRVGRGFPSAGHPQRLLWTLGGHMSCPYASQTDSRGPQDHPLSRLWRALASRAGGLAVAQRAPLPGNSVQGSVARPSAAGGFPIAEASLRPAHTALRCPPLIHRKSNESPALCAMQPPCSC